MDKDAIKKYAVWAREELIEKVTARAVKYDVVKDKELNPSLDSINGEVLSESEKKERKALIKRINEDGYDQVMEEVAYTWFNRFIAIRFMEVNGYLPSHIRVFSNENGEFRPQILSEAIHLEMPGLDMEKVLAYKEDSNEDELFKYLLKVQCNALNKILPQMFQKLEDYTELLLPDYLLREGSVIEKLVNDIPEDNFDISSDNGQIEIIGWMYQYYISAKHEEVVDPLHGKIVKKEEVPAATQLFTTDWVVRYLIDNSVGRYWIERNPDSQLAKELTYFVTPKDGQIKYIDEKIAPQDVTVFDPCVGSGHFLVYAFEVLMKIYVEFGYSERDAASEILKNNLFGVDIDGRAAQLAYFAVMMKARQYDRRFLTRGIQPHFYSIHESNNVDKNGVEYYVNGDSELKKDIDSIIHDFKDAKEYGSLIQVKAINFDALFNRFAEIEEDINMSRDIALSQLKPIVQVAKVMSDKYAVVATNPPYLNKYDGKLKEFVTTRYKDYCGDLFSIFMYRNFLYCNNGGYSGFMTPNVWMFLKTYGELRRFILSQKSVCSLIQMAKGAFYKEATVDVCAFVLKNAKDNIPGVYFRLEDFKGDMDVQKEKVLAGIADSGHCQYIYEADDSKFELIPETPIAYWLSSNMLNNFGKKYFFDYGRYNKGLDTGKNDRFLRLWYEVDANKFTFGKEKEIVNEIKWYPYNKGGAYRKWYGDNEYVINWLNDGSEVKAFKGSNIRNKDMYLHEGITWSSTSSGDFSSRYCPGGYIFDSKGCMAFPNDGSQETTFYLLAAMNTNCNNEFLKVISPTIDYNPGPVSRTPIVYKPTIQISELVKENIELSKEDWDSFETSWDFEQHPLVAFGVNNKLSLIEDAFHMWEECCNKRFEKMHANEELLEDYFAHLYNLEAELGTKINENKVSVRKADLLREIKSFISYAVGCIMGRYSLDKGGLVYAGGMYDPSDYSTFKADNDGIIPICDDEYFDDDIVGKFIQFVEVVYGKDTLEENLQFIADALGGKGSSREVIRNYFINDFYADHVKIYQKRPIYWLFDSGKKNGFKCLIYMHRYQPDTIARIRTDYVHEQQARYRTAIEETEKRIESAAGSDKVKLTKKLNTLKAQDDEIHAYEEKIHHLADQMISIDLDDGVKVNYAKFKDVLAKIK